MPEGWIHAVYSIDVCASVNFWWNQPKAVDFDLMDIASDFGFPDAYTTFRRPNVPPHPVPLGVVLAKKFDTRENEIQRDIFFKKSTKVKIPCQACSIKDHEYHKCPYLGNYQYKRISGQSCDYDQYELVEVPAQVTLSDIFVDTKTYNPLKQPLVPIPEGVTLAQQFDDRNNVMKSQSNMMKDHIDCQACGSKVHELRECPYLGYYESIFIVGQACDYHGFRLRSSDLQEPLLSSPSLAAQPTKLRWGFNEYIPVDRLPLALPPGLTLAQEFDTRANAMNHIQMDNLHGRCQACGDNKHKHNDCPYLGHYKFKHVAGQICSYESYVLCNLK